MATECSLWDQGVGERAIAQLPPYVAPPAVELAGVPGNATRLQVSRGDRLELQSTEHAGRLAPAGGGAVPQSHAGMLRVDRQGSPAVRLVVVRKRASVPPACCDRFPSLLDVDTVLHGERLDAGLLHCRGNADRATGMRDRLDRVRARMVSVGDSPVTGISFSSSLVGSLEIQRMTAPTNCRSSVRNRAITVSVSPTVMILASGKLVSSSTAYRLGGGELVAASSERYRRTQGRWPDRVQAHGTSIRKRSKPTGELSGNMALTRTW